MSDKSIDQDDQKLDAALASMPAIDVGEWSRARIKRRALEVFKKQDAPAWVRILERVYSFAVEPALVFGVAPLYLLWALFTVVGIYQAGGN